MLTELGLDWGKTVVTAAALLAALLSSAPLPAQAVGADSGLDSRLSRSADGISAANGVLPALLENRLTMSLHGVEDPALLFYLQRGFRPAWTQQEKLHGLIEAVRTLDEHGLDAADFALERLRTEALYRFADLPPERQVERELLFTDTLARLLQQLRHGRLNPRTLYADWNFSAPARPLEQAARLAQVLEAPALNAAVQAQAPDLDLYRELQAALKHYRMLATWGDWPKVASGPTLRPDARDPRIAAVRARLAAEERALRALASNAPGSSATGEHPHAPANSRTTGLASLADTTDASHYDPVLVEAVRRFQQRAGLAVDAALGKQTVDALNISPAQRVAQLRVNLERLRWVAQDMQGDHMLVDLTGYKLRLHLGGQLAWSARIVVGKPTRKTPALLDSVQHLVLNPKWVVPPTILREDVVPGVVRNPDYLVKHRMQVVDRSGASVDAQHIDWKAARQHGFPYRVVQDSGADGSLGRIKFSLANPYAIYLHDTNAPSLFRRDTRALSSGCVRVEKPNELAVLLLDDPERWGPEALEQALATGKTLTLPVARQIPVLLHYASAGLDEQGRLQFRPDIYARDEALRVALDGVQR